MNPAPAAIFILRTVTRKPVGAPNSWGSLEKLYWVLAMHTGTPPNPRASSRFISSWAAGRKSTPSAW